VPPDEFEKIEQPYYIEALNPIAENFVKNGKKGDEEITSIVQDGENIEDLLESDEEKIISDFLSLLDDESCCEEEKELEQDHEVEKGEASLKAKNPEKFVLTCEIKNGRDFNAISDLGSSANLMPLENFEKFGIERLKKTLVEFEKFNSSHIELDRNEVPDIEWKLDKEGYCCSCKKKKRPLYDSPGMSSMVSKKGDTVITDKKRAKRKFKVKMKADWPKDFCGV